MNEDVDLLPTKLTLELEKVAQLRYGENPHQSAALYRLRDHPLVGVGTLTLLHGPEISFNNLLDVSAALGLLLEFDDPAAVAMKHTNPCGAAVAESIGEAVRKARQSDPVSIYGGVVGVNRTIDIEAVDALSGVFVEVLFAPAYDAPGLERLIRTRRKAKLLQIPCAARSLPTRLIEYRSVLGGILAQTSDLTDLDPAALTVVSRRPPTPDEWHALRFAWRVAKHTKSNAIILARHNHLIGIGAGQMNRVDAARIAVNRAQHLGLDTTGTVCASDAFFPFRDGVDVIAQSGATAIIHPGGSLRDAEVIDAANEHGLAMVTTHIRHFRH